MGGGLAGRWARLKVTVGGAIATHLQERGCCELFRLEKPSLRANGSREYAPDNRLREAIHSPHNGSSYPRRRVSSTPRLIGSITAASGILGHPPSRVTTTECVSAFSRRDARALKIIRPSKKRAQGMPGACC